MLAASNLFFYPQALYPTAPLLQPPVIQSRGGVLTANVNMVSASTIPSALPAGVLPNPILYGGQQVYTPANGVSGGPLSDAVVAMGYQVSAYGSGYQAQFPGPTFQVQPSDRLDIRVENNLSRDVGYATATSTITAGAVTGLTITDPGAGGYTLTGPKATVPVTIAAAPTGGTTATAKAAFAGVPVASITVKDGGSGYTQAPSVTLSGGGGTGATASAIVSGGKVTGITITNPGSGYTTAPTVTITGSSTANAAASSTIVLGAPTGLTITNPGSGYTTAPAVTIGEPLNAQVMFQTNAHGHGLHVSPLNNGDNVLREIGPGEGLNFAFDVPAASPSGMNWYHVHRHEATNTQVYGGLAGLLQVGDPLDPWPEYKGVLTQVSMGLSSVNIQPLDSSNPTGPAVLQPYNGGLSYSGQFYKGWQKRINGQVNPTITFRPGETQVWNLASIGALGTFNMAITDDNLQNPWNATLLVQDGNGQFAQPYPLSLAADPARMQDIDAATLLAPGNRLTLAVTAPTTPGTYYLVDGWAGQADPNTSNQYLAIATIQVSGEAVTTPPPTFASQPINPLFAAVPDVERDYVFSITQSGTPQFLINGEIFGNGPMPQMQIDTVEEWTLTNPVLPVNNANHPFHIHQGDFIVTEVSQPGVAIASAVRSGSTVTVTTSGPNGLTAGDSVLVQGILLASDPGDAGNSAYNGTFQVASVISPTEFTYTLAGTDLPGPALANSGTAGLWQTVDPTISVIPAQSSLAYISARDVINIPNGGGIKIRFAVKDFPGKYVFHCHILKHEDNGMMSPVLAFGPAAGLRLPVGATPGNPGTTVVLNGNGVTQGVLTPFGKWYTGGIATASAQGVSEFYDTMAVGRSTGVPDVRVYTNGALTPSASFRAFATRRGGVSVAVGDLDADGQANIVVGSRAAGRAVVRIFDRQGTLTRELLDVLPGTFPTGVNVAVGDINGDNFDDLIVSAGRGREPVVTALDGQDLANHPHIAPKVLFCFTAGGGPKAGARVAVGYVAPSSVPSYLANVVTTPEAGPQAGLVQVWNPSDLGVSGHGDSGHTHTSMVEIQPSSHTSDVHASSHDHAQPCSDQCCNPMPMVAFRPFGSRPRAVQLVASYQRLAGSPAGQSVIVNWVNARAIALTSLSQSEPIVATTQIKQTNVRTMSVVSGNTSQAAGVDARNTRAVAGWMWASPAVFEQTPAQVRARNIRVVSFRP